MIEFENKYELEYALFKTIQNDIKNAILKYGNVNILLSGGTTPYSFYKKLGIEITEWDKLNFGLTDERNVNTEDELSNEKLIRTTLLITHPNANFYGMKNNSLDLQDNITLTNSLYKQFLNCDIILLGMGEDGHIASIFPNDNFSIQAMMSDDNIVQTYAPSEPKIRFSISPKLIASSKKCYLFFTGEKKLKQFNSDFKNLPITWIKQFITDTFYTK
jgi:6-phosphogluconolactonase